MDKGNSKTAQVIVSPDLKGIVIGKGGKNINKAKELAKRHHNIEDIVVR
ncbi:MAG: KH domain-containing protein [Archaeoglobaceae archaeon]